MHLHFYRPRHPLLANLMEGYYFLDGPELESQLSYYTFPNNFSILSVLENAHIAINGNQVTCTAANSPCFQANLTNNYTRPLLIQYSGPVNELTIYFKPLGLRAFLPEPAYHPIKDNFSNFDPFADFREVMLRILRLNDRKQQITELEDYWLSKYTSEPDPLLLQIVVKLESGETIAVIADNLQLSRQYLARLFLRNLGKTPATYRKIHRFRRAVNAQSSFENLTALGFGSSFYDQSHFIRDFKELTTFSPGSFFHQVDAGKENLWLYV